MKPVVRIIKQSTFRNALQNFNQASSCRAMLKFVEFALLLFGCLPFLRAESNTTLNNRQVNK